MSFSLSIPIERYGNALLDTLQMVGVSGALALVAGVPLAILLIVTAPGGFLAWPRLHRVLGSIINGFRATPFIVLLVALIPLTRLVAGTTIGVWAAIVPLAISATPFFARIVEVSLREVDPGLVEAAQALGCKKWHIVRHVYLPEALPGIVGGFTITLVALISSSAMAGAVGAGGLGDLAIRYGYQRFDTQVMVIVIALLILLVSLVQRLGDGYVRWLRNR
ncbi:ABC transporter permease [Herbaspirillum rubrisubalbicans]|uniref:ABC transporter permease n=2 Tax=Herbaspirillum rubrisubalbicans TaxID=80842 RepID=A0AAD0U9K1_9BURK|nr:methionine ABC transporter permease [Herbaspirillum rubrisubalbicans]ALU89677.1 metal ion ABC transporter permease [Herbaspirillum rubrisubalbicans M1]AYR24766.1 ABC transporter permease [Herbaspirillum rubrisubalbicans]MCP1572697.1 D-methionine transport system permease protein [Herbaspirillum rubrisubalbicans]NQE47059.1 ABC transporter permease [Herbaspirillum rubrisubalbicans]QJQ01284.1 ABC transporter permease [Herbaspirillum rubrisubalbicans Os34]